MLGSVDLLVVGMFWVSELVSALRPTILCLQETKIATWSPSLVRDIGGRALDGCAVLPAIDTCGGATIFWDSTIASIATHSIGLFSITAIVTLLRSGTSFWLTTGYGPADEARKDVFLLELAAAAPPPTIHG